jgi:precorrin-4/cobalt-precorrin-4 C11-methyltransferase
MGVSFIGAGPGDAGLITVKGKRLIEDADTVIYPGSSINPEILEFSDGKKIYHSVSAIWNSNISEYSSEGDVAHAE